MLDYHYTPLSDGQIRLLKLLPGQHTSELEGNLLIRRLEPRSRYPNDPLEPPLQPQSPQNGLSAPVLEIPSGSANRSDEKSPEEAPKAEAYHALSYTWGGNPNPSLLIEILEGS
jgi:hypothetical protein